MEVVKWERGKPRESLACSWMERCARCESFWWKWHLSKDTVGRETGLKLGESWTRFDPYLHDFLFVSPSSTFLLASL